MDTLLRDLRYSFTRLLKNPSFTLIAVLCLALSIGVNSVVFSAVYAIVLSPLPFENPDELVVVNSTNPQKNIGQVDVSMPDYLDFRDQSQAFRQLAAFDKFNYNLTGDAEPERLQGSRVTAELFPLLGVNPERGRYIQAGEDRPGAPRVAVISHGLWQRRFGGDPQIINKTVSLDGEQYDVVGVMPATFQFPDKTVELWAPLTLNPDPALRGSRSLQVVGRVKPGVTVERAASDLSTVSARLQQQYPDTNAGWGVIVESLHERLVEAFKSGFFILVAAVIFVLLIACANVANLLLGQAAARQKEMALRAALGASRRRLIRQLLTESLLLAGFSGALGLLIAFWGNSLIISLLPASIPRVDQIGINRWVLVFTLAISVLTGIIFGLIPALSASKPDLNETLKEGGRGSGSARQRARSLLVVVELALALMLLINAGLMIKSLLRLRDVKTGFNTSNVLTMQIALPRSKYAEEAQMNGFYQQLYDRVKGMPGAVSAGLTSSLPLAGSNVFVFFTAEGHENDGGSKTPARRLAVSPGYFRTMELQVVKGREFNEQDTANSPPVAMLNESLAKQLWPDGDAIGKRVKLGTAEVDSPWMSVVGIVADSKQTWLNQRNAGLDIYMPFVQDPRRSMALVVRTRSDPTGLVSAVRNEVRGVDANQPVYNVRTMEQVAEESVAGQRIFARLLTLFATLALMLAVAGIYGVMSYSVNQRSHEIGVRMALGAKPRHVLRLIVGQGMLLVIVGVAIGLLLAYAVTRVMGSLLYGVSTTDAATFALISLLLSAVALLSCFIPARRATKVNPANILRYE